MNTPIDPLHDPKKGWIVEKIDPNKEKKSPPPPPSAITVVWKALSIVAKKILLLFSTVEKKEEKPKPVLSEALLIKILIFRTYLATLKDQDASRDSDFVRQLVSAWQDLETTTRLSSYLKKEATFLRLEKLLEVIRTFPRGDEHPLGFYFEENLEREWMPVPFLDLLSSLHTGNRRHLLAWIAELDSFSQ